MIIDFHTHTFPAAIAARAVEKLKNAAGTKAFSDGTDEGLLASMDRAGIAQSVVLPVATNPLKVRSVNESCAKIAEKEKRLIRFGCAHPLDPDWPENLRFVRDAGFAGIKLHPVYQGVDFDDPAFLRLLEKAAEYDLIIVTHSGYDIGFPGVSHISPAMTARVLKQLQLPKLVLAHMGAWRQWEEACELLYDSGALIDTSFSLGELTVLEGRPEEPPMLSPEQTVRIIRAFGADRVLFATDSPWDEQAAAIERIRELELTEKEKEMIFSANARRLLEGT